MMLVATSFVVAGLVLEYWHEIKEFWEHVRWPMAAFPWDKFRAIFGGILVTLGVAGELAFTYVASRRESQLRDNNHRIEALLTKEAGDAIERASKADERASKNEKEAEAERLARVELQDALAPRRLDKEQLKAIGAALKPFGEFALMLYEMGDRESEIFANDIWAGLVMADWMTTQPGGIMDAKEGRKDSPKRAETYTRTGWYRNNTNRRRC